MNNPSEKLIAVVGTMKAGKSTVINAIVGREVLPTSELPMTTIPTLVRHVPGQTEPVLEFSQTATIEALLPQLAAAISNPKNTSTIENLLYNHHNNKLIPSILEFTYRNKKLKKQHRGSVQILEFLRNLNDLTRLCEDFGVDFPFEKFNHIQNFPTIHVEFQSLKDLNNSTKIQLTLLDTPGPSEYGKTALKSMLQEQLQKASTVLAVLDYTQLNSDSNTKINKFFAHIDNKELYVLINKFDQRNKSSRSTEDVVNFVANNLMQENIAENRVFPVSSRNAYLANRALNALDLYQELPDHETEPWVEDFGIQAFGRRWKNNISDLVEAKYAANDIWHESLLQEPLDAILQSLTEQSHHHKNQTLENKITANITPSHLSFLKSQSMPITIEDLQAEAIRLVDIHINILKNILDIDENPNYKSEDKAESVNESHLKTLEGEKTKLENLEAVIAVVGTMKAGKSTTINAIVGTEVLPNRELPMTALPTLIRHTPGKTEPTLHFKNKLPIETLLSSIFEAINNCDSQTINEINQDKHIKELIDSIKSSNNIQEIYKPSYSGSNQIFNFLKSLNDLVRLSTALNINFPFENYQNINEIPFIEIEFTSLKEIKQNYGKLTLLDTPGPNEAGQSHLREMLKDQLEKSSAVLAILDYTQLKSDANEEVNFYLREIASISKGRLYALVNKFDEQGENSLELDEVKSLVANQLLKKEILEDCVFPISSRNAYLSNRALQEIKAHGKLPSHKEQPWVKSFGLKAFGGSWERKISNTDDILAEIKILRDDSLFSEPLEKVIKTSHQKSSFIAIDSTIAKLPNITKNLKQGLNIKTTSFQKTIGSLENQIKNLQEEIDEVSRVEDNANKKKEASIKALKNKTEGTLGTAKKSIGEKLDYYFAEGKAKEEEEEKEENVKNRRKNKNNIIPTNQHSIPNYFSSFDNFFGSQSKQKLSDPQDFKKGSKSIKFNNEKDAVDLMQKIDSSISAVVENSKLSIANQLSESMKEFGSSFANEIALDVKPIIDKIKSDLKKEGFTIFLDIPNISAFEIGNSSSSIIENLIEKKQESVTKYRRQSGAWGTVCKWFGTNDWGYESYETTEDRFEINIEKIKESALNKIEEIFKGLNQSIFEQVEYPLQTNINNFFKELRTNVNELKENFEQSIAYTQKSKEERDEIYEKFINDLQILKLSEKDTQQLVAEIKEFPQNFTQNL